jgi:hypothetical protein
MDGDSSAAVNIAAAIDLAIIRFSLVPALRPCCD